MVEDSEMGASDAATLTGTVKFFKPESGFGFILADDYREYFCHRTQLADCEELKKGQRVSFAAGIGRDQQIFARQIVVVK
jgi:cold shock CspA family protein